MTCPARVALGWIRQMCGSLTVGSGGGRWVKRRPPDVCSLLVSYHYLTLPFDNLFIFFFNILLAFLLFSFPFQYCTLTLVVPLFLSLRQSSYRYFHYSYHSTLPSITIFSNLCSFLLFLYFFQFSSPFSLILLPFLLSLSLLSLYNFHFLPDVKKEIWYTSKRCCWNALNEISVCVTSLFSAVSIFPFPFSLMELYKKWIGLMLQKSNSFHNIASKISYSQVPTSANSVLYII